MPPPLAPYHYHACPASYSTDPSTRRRGSDGVAGAPSEQAVDRTEKAGNRSRGTIDGIALAEKRAIGTVPSPKGWRDNHFILIIHQLNKRLFYSGKSKE